MKTHTPVGNFPISSEKRAWMAPNRVTIQKKGNGYDVEWWFTGSGLDSLFDCYPKIGRAASAAQDQFFGALFISNRDAFTSNALALSGQRADARKLAAIQGGFLSPREAGILGDHNNYGTALSQALREA